mgnify:CR=1 FL=1
MTSTNAEITGQSPTQREIIKVSLRFMHKLKFQRLSANEKLRKLTLLVRRKNFPSNQICT